MFHSQIQTQQSLKSWIVSVFMQRRAPLNLIPIQSRNATTIFLFSDETLCECVCVCVFVLYITTGAVFMFTSWNHPFSISAYPARGQGKLESILACNEWEGFTGWTGHQCITGLCVCVWVCVCMLFSSCQCLQYAMLSLFTVFGIGIDSCLNGFNVLQH